ncbi:MAG: oligoendopeptidase F [Anaerolineales bacterium]|nr:oligoendopeptidase F [Anaerolineales bacterium]
MNKTEEKVPARAEIAAEFTWNAESVFPSQEAWDAELKSIQASLPAVAQYKGRLKDSPAILAEALQTRDELARRIDVAFMYAYMNHAVDKTDQGAASMPGKAQGLRGEVLAAISFIEPEALAIGQETIQAWMQQEARLSIYAHYFDNLFRKQAHIRSAEVEELLGMLSSPFSSVSTTAGMLVDADLKFEPARGEDGSEVEITHGNLPKLYASPDRSLRRSAWERYTDAHLAFMNSLANNLITSVKQNAFLMRARLHNSTLEASLFEQNIPAEVFHNLIDTFRANLPTWQRYFAIRRKALGVDRLQPYDMWAPLTDQRPKVSYPQAVEWICQGLAPMGQEYVATICKGCLEQRWVDVYSNRGKTAGAFSFGSPGTYPFIVMSFTDEVFSLSTLAHELGHSMHSYLTWENQPAVYSDYSLFVAEVASNFHQAMVRAYLLENNNDPHFQIGLIEEAMANFYRYFLIMPTLARFELEIHERVERGAGLNADNMNELMADLFQEAYGGLVEVDRQRVGITWATFRHLYSDYYVYQYATGISGAHALSNRILSGEAGAVQDYLSFLRAGGSMYPLEALKMAGVDLTSSQPVEETFTILANMVDRLERLL